MANDAVTVIETAEQYNELVSSHHIVRINFHIDRTDQERKDSRHRLLG